MEAHPGVVVEEGVEPRTAKGTLLRRVREHRPLQHVGLPQLVGEASLKPVEVVTRPLGHPPRRQVVRGERPMQGASPDLAPRHELQVLGDPDEPVEDGTVGGKEVSGAPGGAVGRHRVKV